MPTTDSRMMPATVCGALVHQDLLEVPQRALALLGLGGRAWNDERYRYGPAEVHDARHAGLGGPAARVAGQRRSSRRCRRGSERYVGHHLVAAGVDARHAHGVLGRLGAAVGEEHHVEVARARARPPAAASSARFVVGVLRRDRAEQVGLLLDRRDHLRVLVADVGVDELRREVEVALAVVVPEPRRPRRRATASGASAPWALHEWKTCAFSSCCSSAFESLAVVAISACPPAP